MVKVAHCRVKGRLRLRVSTLKGNQLFADYLRVNLGSISGILDFRIGTTTGSLLIWYGDSFSGYGELVKIVTELENRFLNGDGCKPPTKKISCTKNSLKRDILPPYTSNDDLWHSMKPEECFKLLHSSPLGISEKEAKQRITIFGNNELEKEAPVSRWQIFIKQFASLPVVLLGAVSVVSIVTGGVGDAVIIAGVVVANAVIGYFTEKSSNEAISELHSIEEDDAIVIRNGKEQIISRKEIVPGDVIVLKAGYSVPADGRLFKADGLFVDESSFSGESMPVLKNAEIILPPNTSIFERYNMVYRGTLVTGGIGFAIVTATGPHTQIGHLQRLLQATDAPRAPIERQLATLGNQIVFFCLAVSLACFLIGIARGYSIAAMIRMSLALGAAAVPEGLPSIATTSFALAVNRMRKRGVLIRDLKSVESLGAIQILCVDKTGTITENCMKVTEIVSGEKRYAVHNNEIFSGYRKVLPDEDHALRKILEISCLCSEARPLTTGFQSELKFDGSPTEIALLNLATGNGVSYEEIRTKFPTEKMVLRSENRPYMVSFHRNGHDGMLITLKGNPEAVLNICSKELFNGEEIILTDTRIAEILRENERLSSQGLRVLGFAYGNGGGTELSNLIWCGLVGMEDPVKVGARDMVALLRKAGIRVIMLTGDQELTAHSVAKAIDLSCGEPIKVIDASRLNGSIVTESDIQNVHIFSRVSPAIKLSVVQALQKSGEKVVGMTGDGINDAPALKAADVGICMGKNGTRVSQKVADVILLDDDLAKLVAAVEEGRTIQDNIRKSVNFCLSSNMSEVIAMTGFLVLGIPATFNTMQLLWINLISDIFPGIALSLDPPSPEILSRPPRGVNEELIDKKELLREASILAGASLVTSVVTLLRGAGPAHASTVSFHTLACSQLIHSLVCREGDSANTAFSFSNPMLIGGIGGSLLLQIAAGVIPSIRRFLGLTPMGILDWLTVAISTVATTAINRMLKRQRIKKQYQLKANKEDNIAYLEKPAEASVGDGLQVPIKAKLTSKQVLPEKTEGYFLTPYQVQHLQ